MSEIINKEIQESLQDRLLKYKKLAEELGGKINPKIDELSASSRLTGSLSNMNIERIMGLSDSSEDWLSISNQFYDNPQYQRLISYYADLFTYSYYVAPTTDGKSINTKKLTKEYNEVLRFLDEQLNVEKFTQDSLRQIFKDGAVFYIYEWDRRDGEDVLSTYNLAPQYCQIFGKTNNGQFSAFRLDLNFLSDVIKMHKNKMTEDEILKSYPKFLVNAYNKYKAGKGSSASSRYIIIGVDKGVAFVSHNEMPPFIQSVKNLLRAKKFEGIRDEYIETALNKIIFQHVETGSDGEPEIDLALASQFHANLKKITKDIPRLNAFTSLAKTEILDLSDSRAKTDLDFIEKFNAQFYSDAGVSRQVFDGENSAAALGASLDKDEAYVWGLMRQIQVWLNFIINEDISKGPKRTNNFVVSYLPVSYRNREKMMNSYLKAAEYGYSKLLPTIAIGVKQRHFESLLYLENDLLKLNERLVPLRSSHTMSNKDSDLTTENQAKEVTEEENKQGRETEVEKEVFETKSSMRRKKDSTLKKEANQ